MDFTSVREIIYSAAALQGFFLSILLFRTKVNQPANKVLAVLLLALAFHLMLVGFDRQEFFLALPHLSRISWIIGSLYWPLIFLFVQHLTGTYRPSFFRTYALFLPFLILTVIMLPYYMLTAEAKRLLLRNYELASQQDFGWVNQVMSMLHIGFQSFFLFYYYKSERKRANEYADIEHIRINWLKSFLWLVLLAMVVAVISFYSRAWDIPLLSKAYALHFAGVVFLFYWVSYKALTQPVLFGLTQSANIPQKKNVELLQEADEKYARSAIADVKLSEIFEATQRALQQDRLFLNSDLTLSALAIHINASRHQVSQAINAQYNGNFFDLINEYRVEKFKLLVKQPGSRHLTLLGIAQEAGFNSKATFYAVFKKKTGMTPAEYVATSTNTHKAV